MRSRTIVLGCFLCLVALPWLAGSGDDGKAWFDAARDGDLATVKRLAEESGVDVDSKTRYGATALSYASDKGHADVVAYLIGRGAEVNTQDSFYQASPITWAAFNGHADVATLLFEAGATGADQVLSIAMREGDVDLVAAALKGGDLGPGAVQQALTRARSDEAMADIVALLEAADIELPEAETERVEVAEAVLGTYVGKYRNTQIGMDIDVRLEEGTLVAQATNQPPLDLQAVSQTKFETVGFPIAIEFVGEEGTIRRLMLDQANQQFAFERVVETAEAEAPPATETNEAKEPKEPKQEKKETPAAPVERTAAMPWPTFRGPGASGIADGQGAPTGWDLDSGENVLWKTPIPGLANSSPIIWGDRVFVTSAVSSSDDDTFRSGLYGDVDSVDDLSKHAFKVYCLDRRTGEILWERTAAEKAPGAKRHMKSTQANSTPVTDGKRVVALFGTIGLLIAYDLEGKELWRRDVGVLDAGWFYDETYQWGHASSPVIHDGLVYVQADLYRDSFIAAYRLKDGEPVWKTAREDVPSWGTPTIVRSEKGAELIANGQTIHGYDPKTGEQRWKLTPNSEVTVATPVAHDGLIYVTGGYPPAKPVYAIRPGGEGDLSLPEGETAGGAIAWSDDNGGTYMPTPIAYRDRLYTCNNNGRLTAYDAKTGEELFRARVGGGGTFTGSPVAADGKLYFVTEEGDVFVIRASDEYDEIAHNELGEILMATPAISDGVMVVRGLRHLFGLGEAETVEAGGAE